MRVLQYEVGYGLSTMERELVEQYDISPEVADDIAEDVLAWCSSLGGG